MVLYALLVGINKYPDSPLKGCVNDVNAMAEYLQRKITLESDLKMSTLTDEQATRQAIIDGFRQHLGQARENDTVLFYYSGHGSQERASEEFQTNYHETLVCWDSWDDEQLALADKELLKLINEVGQNKPHIVIILDCCHSGGLTRDGGEPYNIRRISQPRDERPRPINNFIFSIEELETLLQTEYISLAACEEDEESVECEFDKEYYRGLFSYSLLHILKQNNSSLTYRDLSKSVKPIVEYWTLTVNDNFENHLPSQSPIIEACPDSLNLECMFLEKNLLEYGFYFTVSYNRQGKSWVIDGGALQGIPLIQDEEKTTLAIFPFNSSVQILSELNQKIARGTVTEVHYNSSKIDISEESEALDRKLTYKASIISLALPPLKIYLQGENEGVKLVHEALEIGNFALQYYLLKEVSTEEEADFCLLAEEHQYSITRNNDQRSLITTISNYSPENASKVIEVLAHLSRWQNIATLSNPSTELKKEAVKMQIFQGDKEIKIEKSQENYQVPIEYNPQNKQSPSYTIRLTNESDQDLHCILLNLTESSAVNASLFRGGCISLQSRKTYKSPPFSFTIPEQFRQRGITTYRDILKIILSTKKINTELFELSPVEEVITRSPTSKIKPIKRDQKVLDDWITKEIEIIITENTAQQTNISGSTNSTEPIQDLEIIITNNTAQPIRISGSSTKKGYTSNSLNNRTPAPDKRTIYLKIGGVIVLILLLLFGLQFCHQPQPLKLPESEKKEK